MSNRIIITLIGLFALTVWQQSACLPSYPTITCRPCPCLSTAHLCQNGLCIPKENPTGTTCQPSPEPTQEQTKTEPTRPEPQPNEAIQPEPTEPTRESAPDASATEQHPPEPKPEPKPDQPPTKPCLPYKYKMSLKGHKSYINGLAFLQPGNNGANPGDVILVASSGDPALHTWNVTTGKWLESIPLSHHPHKLKASPNGSWLAYINGSQLQLLRVKNGKPSFGRALKGHTKPIRDFSFQSDDKIVGTAGEDGKLILWDPNQGTQLAQLDDPFGGIKNSVNSIDFHPTDDYVVATEQSSGVVRVWSSLSRKYDIGFTTSSDAHIARFLPKQGHPFNLVYGDIFFHQLTFVSYTMKDGWSFDGKGHTAKIEHIAPHPSGSWFATGSIDKTIRIWELPNDNTPKGGLRHTLTRHTDRIMSTRFSPNGQWLVTSDLTGEVAVWECK